jgi:hypothetical protein
MDSTPWQSTHHVATRAATSDVGKETPTAASILCTKASALPAPSSMCRTRTPSSCCDILVQRLANDLFAEVLAQRPWSVKVDAASNDLGEFFLQLEKRETRHMARLELDQYIDVAFGPEVFT